MRKPSAVMSHSGSSVTLIFYAVGDKWWKEPTLNLLAALFQMSSYTHVELAIGEAAGQNGMMANVARVFNDNIGCELTERTGRNPAYTYCSLGCSHAAEQRMLAYARAQVGKPFSNFGMARSLVWPRQTDGKSFFCAELVAAILQRGGLLSHDSNPGAATPHSLYNMYSKQAAATANPYALRSMNLTLGGMAPGMTSSTVAPERSPLIDAAQPYPQDSTPCMQPVPLRNGITTARAPRARTDSPPRAAFRVINIRGTGAAPPLSISLAGLKQPRR